MARKLTLEPVTGFSRSVKEPQRKRATTRREPPPTDLQDSQDQLDSGLGSIDSQPRDWCTLPGAYRPLEASSSYHRPYSYGCSSYSGPAHYGSYGGYPASVHAYGRQGDFQQQYWSDPLAAHPSLVQQLPGEAFPWGQQTSPRGLKEREAVRKKLLAIFSVHLVDAAMDMFPELMEPEQLVAQILLLQSQSRSLR